MLQRASAAFGQSYDQLAQDYPVKRIVSADEIARVVMWLASPDASAVHAPNIDASAGYLAR
jgi:NAD(P)-dependent dehydrogenase (short-subunit alcohol dehydrogenase family)